MKSRRVIISVILSFLLISFLGTERSPKLLAIFTAAFIHELGHLIALWFLGLRLKNISLEPSGLKIDYIGLSSAVKDGIVAFAGPAVGICYYLLLCTVTNEMLALSADLSLIYSLFNLLPVLPLDGGNVLLSMVQSFSPEMDAIKYVSVISYIVSFILCILALVWMLKGEGSAMFAACLWLLILQS